jgi:CRP/FNR family transcriptional regulator, anaerobic regulatory protein
MDKILNQLNSIFPLSKGLWELLSDAVIFRKIRKKEFLLRPGETARYLYFIETGLVRCYYIKDEEEVSTWFMPEGNIITSVLSFFRQLNGFEYMVALEDTELYALSFDDFMRARRLYSEFNYIALDLLIRYYIQSEERLLSLRRTSADEKMAYVTEHLGELLQRGVPKKVIASYMDLAPWTMSRR